MLFFGLVMGIPKPVHVLVVVVYSGSLEGLKSPEARVLHYILFHTEPHYPVLSFLV